MKESSMEKSYWDQLIVRFALIWKFMLINNLPLNSEYDEGEQSYFIWTSEKQNNNKKKKKKRSDGRTTHQSTFKGIKKKKKKRKTPSFSLHIFYTLV